MKYPIKYAANPPSQTFDVNDLEENFFDVLHSKLADAVNQNIKLIRLANGTILVECKGYYVGKINLQGKKHVMQIMESLYKSYETNDKFIEHIDEWVKYINKHIIKEL